MVKRLFHLLILVLMIFSWKGFVDSKNKIERLETELSRTLEEGEEDEVSKLESKIEAAEGERLFMGLLLTVFSCGVVGIFIGLYAIPFLAQRATHAIYDSGELAEQDKMREAHSLLAQGEYEEAMESFRKAAEEDPTNRLPWVEMAKIQRSHLENPTEAANILRQALEAHEWAEDDAAFLLFRLAEIHDEDLEDRPSGRAIMQQVIDTFPESRHSANASHKLHEWDREDEEQAFIDQQGSGPGGPAL